ncbi:hypothetical protein [Ilumatobacter sp.]|uniref:hypothetical protein n=1 Tax=Ilumatobacter sp. TaxID=1967498 RepID=UPI003B52DF7B
MSGAAQYRVVVAKKDERVEGPDDAPVVVTVPVDVASRADFDAAVSFMRGDLKASGPSGEILRLLESGEADRAVRGIVAVL